MSETTQKWNDLVQGQMALGKTKHEAVRLLAARYPALHRAFLVENQGSAAAARTLGPMPTAADLAVEELGERDAAARFGQLVADVMATQHVDRKTAVKISARKSPKLHSQFLAATNAGGPRNV